MTSRESMLNNLEFEKEIKGMTDRSLLEFTAREVYGLRLESADHSKRINDLEKRDRKFFGAVGGVGGAIGAGIITAIDYFFHK